ncbi:MAG: tetratricopeptide repeat protein [Nitrospirae bacterium]|nr:tetratricopeptide repeat protein [Nitrospirota bacterium]
MVSTNRYDQAIIDFTKSIELDPKNDKTYFYRGLAFGLKGNEDLAIADCKVAARLGNSNAQKFLQVRGLNW